MIFINGIFKHTEYSLYLYRYEMFNERVYIACYFMYMYILNIFLIKIQLDSPYLEHIAS